MTQPDENNNWRRHAACAGVGGDVFYPPEDDEPVLGENIARPSLARFTEAKAICNTCMVQNECLETALTAGEQHGIWGGLSPNERRAIRKERGITSTRTEPLFVHGTAAGYKRHRRADEPACQLCLAAESRTRLDREDQRRNNDE